MIRLFFDREDNIVGKRRKCWFPAFSPFPTMFSKAYSFGSSTVLCVKGVLYVKPLDGFTQVACTSHLAGSFGPTVELPELEQQFQCVRLGVFRF